jgi:hypothetical protein
VLSCAMIVRALLALSLLIAPAEAAIPSGPGNQTAALGDVSLQVATWAPTACTPAGILIVFAGLHRTTGPYRDYATPLAERNCLILVAPLLDPERFPPWSYQRGGVVQNGVPLQPDRWTVNLVPRLIAWARQQASAPLPVALLGHSAAAQFLSRVAAYIDTGAARIIIANSSTWLRPRLDNAAPYGFGGLFAPAAAEAALRRYVGAPITVLLGGEDVGDVDLARGPEAEAQGATRLARGQNILREAETVAGQNHWPFFWHAAIIPRVGHSARRIFTSDAAYAALAGFTAGH